MTHASRSDWFKSSYSEGSGNNCVEVRLSPNVIEVRDSKDTTVPSVRTSSASWTAFLARIPQ
ncbi:DUF397 domain-containing protein [Streptomyces sp. NPDC088745]|uniref:DUF397 domain-containing protein n=1 Tax=Streptomyces sp. NPDC088745 TaxID=3365884 RepID=UPI0038126F37